VQDAPALLALVRSIVEHGGTDDGFVLVVLDQLEEVFRTDEGSSARRTLRLLLDAATDHSGRLVVLATMRSEHLDEFQTFDGAAHRYEEFTLDPMPRSRFAEIIAVPAQRCSVELEPGLVERLVEDADHADALPMLAFTLEELYDKSGEDNKLTIDEYTTTFPTIMLIDASGRATELSGVPAAIMLRTNKILEEEGFGPLDSDWRDGTEPPRMRDLRTTFMRLVDVSPDRKLLRRRAPRSDLPESCGRVIDRLIDARLLVLDADEMVSVAHEAMFRAWHSFRIWLEQNENALLLRTQIRRAATDWDLRDRAAYLRWPEGRVVDAVSIMERTGIIDADPFDAVEHGFLGALGEKQILSELERPDLTIVERGALGRRLALFGDRRPGVHLDRRGLPDIAWLPVPSGTVELRGTTEQESRRLSEAHSRLTGGSVPDPASGRLHDRRLGPDQMVLEVPGFEVSKYPITRAQFTVFTGGDDFFDPTWWEDAPQPTERPAPQRGFRNHPATRLSFFAARAFCRWLAAHTSTQIRLPNEFEWQQAATGGDDRLYPWGDQFDDIGARANTFDSRTTDLADVQPTTTPVGVFPLGASPVGAMDMSGNVWEWCDSDFFGDGRNASRVVRGGSWLIGGAICTCIYAGALIATADRYFVGLRPIRTST
jgi:formylglycine-generating enzyme required for sulfatase activity